MSEYQYYEFQKVDGLLGEEDQRALRACSTRARITSNSFVNEYTWGSFKGKTDLWMEKYFDGHLYLANWGTRHFQLSIPASLLPLETARRHCHTPSASSRGRNGRVILTFNSENDSDWEWLEGEGLLAPLLQIRQELACGDLRSLYLGWLLGVQAGDCEASDEEPPVPPNLKRLSGPQECMVKFLRIDRDLLAAAARQSPDVEAKVADPAELAAWVAALSSGEKDNLLLRLMAGEEAGLRLELSARFQRRHQPAPPLSPSRRSVEELLEAASAMEKERLQTKARQAAKEEARRVATAAKARADYMAALKGRSKEIWEKVEALAATRQAKHYDEAARLVADLRELSDLEGAKPEFKERLALFRREHAAKRTLIGKLS